LKGRRDEANAFQFGGGGSTNPFISEQGRSLQASWIKHVGKGEGNWGSDFAPPLARNIRRERKESIGQSSDSRECDALLRAQLDLHALYSLKPNPEWMAGESKEKIRRRIAGLLEQRLEVERRELTYRGLARGRPLGRITVGVVSIPGHVCPVLALDLGGEGCWDLDLARGQVYVCNSGDLDGRFAWAPGDKTSALFSEETRRTAQFEDSRDLVADELGPVGQGVQLKAAHVLQDFCEATRLGAHRG